MPNNVEMCRQSVMHGVSSAVQLDSDGQLMVCHKFQHSNYWSDSAEVFNLCHAVDPTEIPSSGGGPKAQGALASTFRTPGWARTCLTKIAYPTDLNSTEC